LEFLSYSQGYFNMDSEKKPKAFLFSEAFLSWVSFSDRKIISMSAPNLLLSCILTQRHPLLLSKRFNHFYLEAPFLPLETGSVLETKDSYENPPSILGTPSNELL
jgi:hypothetical protein